MHVGAMNPPPHARAHHRAHTSRWAAHPLSQPRVLSSRQPVRPSRRCRVPEIPARARLPLRVLATTALRPGQRAPETTDAPREAITPATDPEQRRLRPTTTAPPTLLWAEAHPAALSEDSGPTIVRLPLLPGLIAPDLARRVPICPRCPMAGIVPRLLRRGVRPLHGDPSGRFSGLPSARLLIFRLMR